MSTYEEFLEESKLLSGVTDDSEDELEFRIAVPLSRPRGTCGEWMKEIVIQPEVLDSIVCRYDSTSWSATGGNSSSVISDVGKSTKPAATAWKRKPVTTTDRSAPPSMSMKREMTKEGGANGSMRDMRGVSVGATRTRSVIGSRARALMLRAESSQDSQRLGETGSRSSKVNQQDSQSSRHRNSPANASTTSYSSYYDSEWPPVNASRVQGPTNMEVRHGRKDIGTWDRWCSSRDTEERKKCLEVGLECNKKQEDVIVESEEDVETSDDYSIQESLRINNLTFEGKEKQMSGDNSGMLIGGNIEGDGGNDDVVMVDDVCDLICWSDESDLLVERYGEVKAENEIDLLGDDLACDKQDLLTGGDLMGGSVDLLNGSDLMSEAGFLTDNTCNVIGGGEIDLLTGGDLMGGVIDLLNGSDLMSEAGFLTDNTCNVIGGGEIDLLTGGDLMGGVIDLLNGSDLMSEAGLLTDNTYNVIGGGEIDLLTGGDLMGGVGQIDLLTGGGLMEGGGEGDVVMRVGGEGDVVMGVGDEGGVVMGVGDEGDVVMGGGDEGGVVMGVGDGGDVVMGGGDEGGVVMGVGDGGDVVMAESEGDVVMGRGEGDVVMDSQRAVENETRPRYNGQDTVTGVKTLHPTTITVEVSSTANTWGPTYGEKGNSSVEADDEVKDVVQMKCGCNIDALDYHTDYMGQWSHSNMCGGRADPELPAWANDEHTLVISNIPTTVSEEEFEETVSVFGDVTNCAIQNEAGLHTAYVRMKERESCLWVISCFHDMPYGNGASKPMACYMLQHDTQHL